MFCIKTRNSVAAALFAAVSVVGVGSPVHATTLNLDYTFSGSVPNSTSPYLIADFSQSGSDVVLTLTSSLEAAGEFISNFYFNYGSSTSGLSASDLSMAVGATTGVFTDPTYSYAAPPPLNADGGGYFAGVLSFATASAGRFDGTDSVQLTFSSLSGATLNANDFTSFFSDPSGSNGVHILAAHVQGITGNGLTCSGWVGAGATPSSSWAVNDYCTPGRVPVPASFPLILTGLGALGAAGALRRRKNRKAA